MFQPEPPADCAHCDRLVAYRRDNQHQNPEWFNGAAPSFGPANARLLIVGLAPGLKGANRSGRVFTGDASGEVLFQMLQIHGFCRGVFDNRPDDGLRLKDAMITNAVRCAPPQNKPNSIEIKNCRPYLQDRILSMPRLRAILCLGRVAHYAVLAAMGAKPKAMDFKHGARAELRFCANPLEAGKSAKRPIGKSLKTNKTVTIFDSFHCSRYNMNTKRLTPEMFEDVFLTIKAHLSQTSL